MKRIIAAVAIGTALLVGCGGSGSSAEDHAKAGCRAVNEATKNLFSNLQDPNYDVYPAWRRAAAAFDGNVPAKINDAVGSFKDSIGPTGAAQVVVACVDAGYLTKREANLG